MIMQNVEYFLQTFLFPIKIGRQVTQLYNPKFQRNIEFELLIL